MQHLNCRENLPRFGIGDVKITSRTLCPSPVTSGKSPPSGPACPIAGLLHTLLYKEKQ